MLTKTALLCSLIIIGGFITSVVWIHFWLKQRSRARYIRRVGRGGRDVTESPLEWSDDDVIEINITGHRVLMHPSRLDKVAFNPIDPPGEDSGYATFERYQKTVCEWAREAFDPHFWIVTLNRCAADFVNRGFAYRNRWFLKSKELQETKEDMAKILACLALASKRAFNLSLREIAEESARIVSTQPDWADEMHKANLDLFTIELPDLD